MFKWLKSKIREELKSFAVAELALKGVEAGEIKKIMQEQEQKIKELEQEKAAIRTVKNYWRDLLISERERSNKNG